MTHTTTDAPNNTGDSIIQPMPALAGDQLDSLRAEIKANGVLVPVVKDQYGRILDGNNRAAIAAELGIDYPVTVVEVTDDQDAWDKAVALNCSRRHMTRAEVRTVVAGEIIRRPEDSDRAIARRVGCSPSTVGMVRSRLSNLDTLRTTCDHCTGKFPGHNFDHGAFDHCANDMRVHACLEMMPLLFHPKVTTAQVEAAWQTGMADLDANKFLGATAAVWLHHEVFQPLAHYLANEWTGDKERLRGDDEIEVYSDAELAHRLKQLTTWLPMMAVVLRESWPEVFTEPDTWVAARLAEPVNWWVSNLDSAEAVVVR